MLQPISFEVIRQAISWHDFPQPVIRQLSFYEWDSCFSGEYLLTWELEDIPAHLRSWVWSDKADDWWKFEEELQECFCSDVRVIKLVIDSDPMHVKVLVHVEVDKQPKQLELWESGLLSLPAKP